MFNKRGQTIFFIDIRIYGVVDNYFRTLFIYMSSLTLFRRLVILLLTFWYLSINWIFFIVVLNCLDVVCRNFVQVWVKTKFQTIHKKKRFYKRRNLWWQKNHGNLAWIEICSPCPPTRMNPITIRSGWSCI